MICHLPCLPRAMARANHPDKNPLPQARAAFLAGQAAYERLLSGAAGGQGPQKFPGPAAEQYYKCSSPFESNQWYSPAHSRSISWPLSIQQRGKYLTQLTT
eukprot:1157956-Pelagomonas_calceolata.AAC.7